MLLEVKDISAGYGQMTIVRDISLTVGKGEVIALLGANGAGKTTILRAILGLIGCRSGSISLDGRSIMGLPTHEIARSGVALVADARYLFGQMTVMENLLLGQSGGRQAGAAVLHEVFELFPQLQGRRAALARSLSGGEQQMLAMGRALMTRPKVLILDEPSTGLSPRMVQVALGALTKIAATGVGLLVVEQSVRSVEKICGRGYLIRDGRIVFSGVSEELFRDDVVREKYFGDGSIEAG